MHAEVQAQTLQRQRVIEEKKMREMEKIREQIERLLDEERQAKKDEEIVRTLQARILNEEWARRETLEKLQEEQRKMLESERKKREEFEKMQGDKEKELKGIFEACITYLILILNIPSRSRYLKILDCIYTFASYRGTNKS